MILTQQKKLSLNLEYKIVSCFKLKQFKFYVSSTIHSGIKVRYNIKHRIQSAHERSNGD